MRALEKAGKLPVHKGMFKAVVVRSAWLAACVLVNVAIAGNPGPTETLDRGLAVLEAASNSLKAATGDSPTAHDVVGEFLRQYADLERASRLVLADYWEKTGADQRTAFKAALERRVADLLLELIAGLDFGEVVVSPFEGDIAEIPVTIVVSAVTADRTRVKFNLRMHNLTGAWRILDVTAEGVSYLKLFISEFRHEAALHGVDRAIARFSLQPDN